MDAEPPDASLPTSLALAPGVTVLRREPGVTQVGHGPRAVPVAHDPRAASVLASLRAGVVRWSAETDALLRRLWQAGLLVDAAAWGRDRGHRPGLAATSYADRPSSAAARLRRRDAARVLVDVPPAWQPELSALLAAAGLAETREESADVALLASDGEPDRLRLDALSRAGTPHLLVRTGAAEVVLGPFVVPGRTACVRCEDAHRTDADPRWPLLLAQLTRAPGDLGPEPVLQTLAWAFAIRDLASYAEGDLPRTWSARISLRPDLVLPRRELLRHPHCGCAWGDLLEVPDPAA